MFELPEYTGIDYSRPVIGYGNFTRSIENNRECMVDRDIVKSKFRAWRSVGHTGILTAQPSGTIEERRSLLLRKQQALNLLKDKTIFSYANFKFNAKPLMLRYYQDIVLSDPYDRILCAWSNQIGKSICLDTDAATDFIKDHGHEWVGLLVSKSLDQSSYQMSRIKGLLKSAGISYRIEETDEPKSGQKDNSFQISYTFYEDDRQTPKYRNLLICCPPTGSALGYPANVILLDEFDFWENIDQAWFISQVAESRTIDTHGKIKIFSNPNGTERYLHFLWNEKLSDGSHKWHRYNFNYWDMPGCTQEQFDRQASGNTYAVIDSKLLARFSRSEGAFLSSDEIAGQFDPDLAEKGDQAGYGRETAWFLDVGSVHDQCVLTGTFTEPNPDNEDFPYIKAFWIHKYPVGYPLARVFGVDNAIDHDDGWADYVEDNPSVKDVLAEYAITELMPDGNEEKFQPLFGFDATGNAGLLPLCQSAGIDAFDITFTGKLKWHMYQRYQYYTQQGLFRRGHDRDNNTVMGSNFAYQASKLVVKKGTTTSYKQIHHENEDDLDDTQDSIVGNIYLIENPDMPSLSFDIISSIASPVTGEGGESATHSGETTHSPSQYIPSFYDRKEFKNWIEQRDEMRE